VATTNPTSTHKNGLAKAKEQLLGEGKDERLSVAKVISLYIALCSLPAQL